jgi:hypothetical protein
MTIYQKYLGMLRERAKQPGTTVTPFMQRKQEVSPLELATKRIPGGQQTTVKQSAKTEEESNDGTVQRALQTARNVSASFGATSKPSGGSAASSSLFNSFLSNIFGDGDRGSNYWEE